MCSCHASRSLRSLSLNTKATLQRSEQLQNLDYRTVLYRRHRPFMIASGSSTVLRRSLASSSSYAGARQLVAFKVTSSISPCRAVKSRHISNSASRFNASAIEEGAFSSRDAAKSSQGDLSSLETPLINFDRRTGQIGITWSSGIESK